MGLRVIAYATDAGEPNVASFKLGAWWGRTIGAFDLVIPFVTTDALAADDVALALAKLPAGSVDEVQFWGHAHGGSPKLAKDEFDTAKLEAWCSTWNKAIAGPEAIVWWRGCSTFAGPAGKAFAAACARALNCRVAGFTYESWLFQAGLHAVAPGEAPNWPDSEGLNAHGKMLLSWPWSLGGRCVTALRLRVP